MGPFLVDGNIWVEADHALKVGDGTNRTQREAKQLATAPPAMSTIKTDSPIEVSQDLPSDRAAFQSATHGRGRHNTRGACQTADTPTSRNAQWLVCWLRVLPAASSGGP